LTSLFEGYGYDVSYVEGSEAQSMHQALAATLEHCVLKIQLIQQRARQSAEAERPRWPMIVFRSPKGWTAPAEIEGHKIEGSWRSHQVPVADVSCNPAHLAILEHWLRSYRPEELFNRPAL
jgi:xylulose-5-phosphate/fructose-6-phosphate phosphoketolase